MAFQADSETDCQKHFSNYLDGAERLGILPSQNLPMSLGTSISPPSGSATGSFNGLHPKSDFLAIEMFRL